MKYLPYLITLAALAAAPAFGQQPITPDLAKFPDPSIWRIHNRTASAVPDRPEAVRVDAREGDGTVWLVGSDFREGTIEFDVRGANKPGQSFVGIAFRGVNDTTYDAVYFRPFNFKNPETIRRSRAVQYVSMPTYPWPRLREEHPGKYESTVNPVPDPDDWFRIRILVQDRTIKVYVNNAIEPCLTVTELSTRQGGRIGLWVGNGSAGDFANLKVIPRAN